MRESTLVCYYRGCRDACVEGGGRRGKGRERKGGSEERRRKMNMERGRAKGHG